MAKQQIDCVIGIMFWDIQFNIDEHFFSRKIKINLDIILIKLHPISLCQGNMTQKKNKTTDFDFHFFKMTG